MPDPIAYGLDYSARRLSGASIKAAGYSFVLRYLDFPGQRWPALNLAEYQDLTLHDIDVHGVFEISIHDPSTGRVGGRQNAITAVNSARAAGLPQGSTIFMCADAPVSTWNYPMSTAMDYLDAARIIIEDSGYILGAYGFKEFIYAAQDGGHADRFWLCGAESGVRDGIHAYQWNNGRVWVDGLECDLNKMYIEIGDDVPTTGEIWGHGIEDPNQPGVNYPAYDWLRFGRIKAGEALDMTHQIKAEIIERDTDIDARFAEMKAANAAILAKLDSLSTGGVSKEEIAEIAVDAVKDELSD